MVEIDEAYVDAAAPNANAIKNGRGLVQKSKFVSLNQSPDATLLFGECAGSGKSNYHCSADFVRPDTPTFRCSCPSRQFPCKHCLGLLYCKAQGKPFATAEIPGDIAAKRDNLAKRATKKKADASQPRKVNKSALKKKLTAQLEGLDLLETLLHDIVGAGLGNFNAKAASSINQQAKQLGNAYLPGAQAALLKFVQLMENDSGAVREASYTEALDQLTRVHALVRQGRGYLEKRAADPELKPDTDSAIAAWLGHAWQLRELGELGLVETGSELLQLAFTCSDDPARREFVDTGTWINLVSGAIQLTQNFRPYKATKFIREDDSVFHVVAPKELFIYPGDLNPRTRWEEMTPRPATPADFEKARSHARSDFPSAVKEVKNQLKSPLADRSPALLVQFDRIGKAGDALVAEDAGGNRITLADDRREGEPDSTHFFSMLPGAATENQCLLLRFHHDLDSGRLRAKPLSVLTGDAVIRLTY